MSPLTRTDAWTAALFVCAVAVTAITGRDGFINEDHPTVLTPPDWAMITVWVIVFLLQAAGLLPLIIRSNGPAGVAKETALEAVADHLMSGWIAQCAWKFLLWLKDITPLLFAAPVLMLCAYHFTMALAGCTRLPSTLAPITSATIGLACAITAAWTTFSADLGVLVAVVHSPFKIGIPENTLAIIALLLLTLVGLLVTVNLTSPAYGWTLAFSIGVAYFKNRNPETNEALDYVSVGCMVLIFFVSYYVAPKMGSGSSGDSAAEPLLAEAAGPSGQTERALIIPPEEEKEQKRLAIRALFRPPRSP